MKAQFWHERWALNQIGFHQQEFHPLLLKHWSALSNKHSAVLVPLCGKTNDMRWLRSKSLEVTGIELSDTAINEFIEQCTESFSSRSMGELSVHQADGYRLMTGDFFNLNKAQLGEVNCVYDRAALVALPTEMREEYVAKLQSLLPIGSEQLLIAIEYDQSKRDGPPFSIDQSEVERLYGNWCEITVLEKVSSNDDTGPFAAIEAYEVCYRLRVE